MSSLLFVLCMILLCLSSLHACHARHHLHKYSSETKHTHNFCQHVKKIRHIDESDNNENLGGAVKISKAFSNGLPSGSDQIETSSGDHDMQQGNNTKGLKREMRLMMGTSNAAHDTEEALESKDDNEIGEDIVVMDYAQPHKKPPIHNEKP